MALAMGIASAAEVSCPTDPDLIGAKTQAAQEVLDSLKGTVATFGNSLCSGAMVTFKGRSSSAPALVLSAAHCSDRGKVQLPLRTGSMAAPDMGEVLYRASYSRPLTLDTGNSDSPRTCVEADEIVYGTMTGADIVLLRLTETYAEIERRTGVRPFLVAEETAFAAGMLVRMPSSVWQNDRVCQIDATVETLKEHRWSWGPVLRLRAGMSTCAIPHGTSGAPVIRIDTGEIIGVAGTASDASGNACELNNPCEVNSDGSIRPATQEQPYVHFVHMFYRCLDAARNVDLDVAGCGLPKP
jgi:hypothetical protein